MILLTDEQNKLVEDNIPLVHLTLRKFSNRAADYNDMYQQGCMGLCKAALYFDASLGYAFSTYAISMIEGEIMRYFREFSYKIKIPRSAMAAVNELITLQSPTDNDIEQISKKYKIKKSVLRESYNAVSICSYDSPIKTDDDDLSMKDLIKSDSNDYDSCEFSESLKDALNKTVESEESDLKRRIYRYYVQSCLDGNQATQTEMAHKFKTNQVFVSRTISKLNKCLKLELYK